jgi:diguanylate cyclase (GGDEF)-like protein
MSQLADGHAVLEQWHHFRQMIAESVAAVPLFLQVVQEQKPVTFDANAQTGLLPARWIEPFGIQRLFAVPLVSRGRVIGLMTLDDVGSAPKFTSEQIDLATTIGAQVTAAIENARLFASVERQVAQLAALREIDHTLSSILDLTPMLETMLNRLAQVLPYDSAAILLLDGHILRAVAARGREQAALNQFILDVSNNPVFREMARTQTPIIIGDLLGKPGWATVAGVEFARAWLGAPLVARGAIIGQIGLFSATPHAFAHEHSDLLRAFANHAAIAIANAQLRAELHKQASRDSLTQALNHGPLIAELRAAGETAKQTNTPLAMIMLDLDDFKRYNDTFGHVVGDAVLTATVDAIRTHVKQTDLVGRWGGEEFSIALPGADTAQTLRVAERIRETLAQTIICDSRGTPIPPPTASQGIAVLGESARNVDELIEHADGALYRAKNRGKDQVAVSEQ